MKMHAGEMGMDKMNNQIKDIRVKGQIRRSGILPASASTRAPRAVVHVITACSGEEGTNLYSERVANFILP